jgi:hypothetical protein
MSSAAEWEYLVGMPGEDIIKGDATNIGVFLSLALVALANIAVFQERRTRKTPVKSETKEGGKM